MKGIKFVGVILGLTWRKDSGWKWRLSDSSGEQRERASFTIRHTIAFGSSSASATTFSISISIFLSPSLWVFLFSRHWRWIKLSLVTAGLTFDFGLDLYGVFYLPERPWPWAHHMITVASHGQVCDDTIVTWNRSTRWSGLLIKVSLFAYLRIFNFQEHGFIHETESVYWSDVEFNSD